MNPMRLQDICNDYYGIMQAGTDQKRKKMGTTTQVVPIEATVNETFDLEAIKRGYSDAGVLDLVLSRWSPRAFAATPVTEQELKQVFSAGLWAASSFNEQPWRFVIGRKGDKVWNLIFDALTEGNRQWARTAPILFATFAKKTFSRGGAPNRHASHDVGAASSNISLQAAALGLHTHGMAGFNPDQLHSDLQAPDDFEAVAAWALGHLGNPVDLPDKFRPMELSPRSRKSIDEVVFSGDWGQPGL